MSDSLEILVNGQKENFTKGLTVSEILFAKKVVPETVVVEVNMNIVPRESFGTVELSCGDCVEILQFVGGG
jgi:sulfur carrier protein